MTNPVTTLRRALLLLGNHDLHMQISTALTLLFIAEQQDRPGGISTVDLQKRLGLSNAAASRNTYYWAEGTPGKVGPHYISVALDPMDRRRRILRLTPKGESFVAQLKEALDGS